MNNLVWAKLKYCYHWPAMITEAPSELGKVPKNRICVMFFATNNYGFVTRENVVDYVQHRAKFTKKNRCKQFLDAVQQIDNLIRDPINFSSKDGVNPTNNRIHIKQERDFVVKTENDIDEHPFVLEEVEVVDVRTQINQLRDEKDELIAELVSVKSDNQKLTFEVQRGDDQINELKRKLLDVEAKSNSKVRKLEAELSDVKQKYSAELELNAQSNRANSDLKKEKRELLARMKQLQQSANDNFLSHHGKKSNDIGKNTEDDESYEVETIVDHHLVNGKRQFLIRWKKFSSDDDSWVKEENLYCPKILKAYLKKRNL